MKNNIADKIDWGWDLNLKDKDKKDYIFKQLYKFLCSAKDFPEMGTDAQGSSSGFDWYLLTEFEARKIIEDMDKDKK